MGSAVRTDARSEHNSVGIPVVVEIVDAPDRIDGLLAELGPMAADGLTTVEPVRAIRYTHHGDGPEHGGAGEGRPERGGGPGEFPIQPRTEGHAMPIEGEARRLTIYIGSSDTWRGRNLAAVIIGRCRSLGMAGATASLGVMGFGEHSRVHRAHLFGLSEDLPEKIEVVDRADRIARLLPALDEVVQGGLIILEEVRVIHYGAHPDPPAS